MQYVEKISDLVSKWKGAYVCAVQSYVGLKNAERERLLLSAKMVFEPWQSGVEATNFSIETEHIFAGRSVRMLRPEETAAFIESAAIGEMDGVGRLDSKQREDRFSFYSFVNYHPLCGELTVKGNSRQYIQNRGDFPQYIDWEMKTGDMPFDSFDDLLVYCGLPRWNLMRDETMFELIFKAPGRIDERSTIKGNNGIVECQIAKALEIDKVKIGLRIFEENHCIIRKSFSGSSLEWRENGDLRIGVCKVNVNDAPVTEAYLSYDGIPFDQLVISDPQKRLNSRYAIHRLLDPEGDGLCLTLKQNKSDLFEGGISILLFLLGFSTSTYGQVPKFKEGPDIIAIAPNGNIAVIECTLGGLNNKDKLEKVMQRTQSIREKLDDGNHAAVKVLPVIVTALPKSEVAVGIDEARDHRVAVVCKENLEDALKQIELPVDANRFFEELQQLIPAPKNEFLLSNAT